MRRLLRRLVRSRSGSASAELAMILPIVMVLVAGIIEVGGYYSVYTATNRLATQYAIAWADCTDSPAGTCNTELSSYMATSAITNVVPQLTASKLSLQMFEVTMNGTTPTVTYSNSTSGAASLTSAQTTLAQATFPSGQTGVIVTATYAHTLNFFSILMTPFLGPYLNISYTVVQQKS